MIPTASSTIISANVPAPPELRTADFVPPQPSAFENRTNVDLLGDVLDDHSSSFPLTDGENEEIECAPVSSTTNNPTASTTTPSSPTRHDDGQSAITSILANESLNVPAYSDDKMIPMIKLMTAVRQAGAPLNLLDSVVTIPKEKDKVGRLEMSSLCTNRTAIRRIQIVSLSPPTIICNNHSRKNFSGNEDWYRSSLSYFPSLSFPWSIRGLTERTYFLQPEQSGSGSKE